MQSKPFFPSFEDFERYLCRQGLFRMEMGLERMAAVIESFDLIRPPATVIHVVGTNGKGSTGRYLESIARGQGRTTGLFSSPHFVDVRERILLNGRIFSRAHWLEMANQLFAESKAAELTYFEILTCLAALAFANAGVSLWIMEAGLGGTLDATCVFETDLALLTPIALDHQNVLGDSLLEIAVDKVGCLCQAKMAVTAVQDDSVYCLLRDKADNLRIKLLSVSDFQPDFSGCKVPCYLKKNAELALTAWKCLTEYLDASPAEREYCAALGPDKGHDRDLGIEQAVSRTRLPGRVQVENVNGRPVVLDGAHNPAGMAALKNCLVSLNCLPELIIFACMDDKQPGEMCSALTELGAGRIFLPELKIDSSRGCSPFKLAEMLKNLNVTDVTVEKSVPDCLKSAFLEPGTILICGSLYLLGEIFSLHPGWLRV